MEKFDAMRMIETSEYPTFTEIKTMIMDSKGVPSEELTIAEGAASLLLSVARDMPKVQQMILSNLTGVTLDTEEERYDYLTKSLKLNAMEVAKMGVAQLMEVDMAGFMNVAGEILGGGMDKDQSGNIDADIN